MKSVESNIAAIKVIGLADNHVYNIASRAVVCVARDLTRCTIDNTCIESVMDVGITYHCPVQVKGLKLIDDLFVHCILAILTIVLANVHVCRWW